MLNYLLPQPIIVWVTSSPYRMIRFLAKLITEAISYGVNYRLYTMFLPALSLGLQAKIGEKITFALNYELETIPMKYVFLLPSHHVAGHSLLLGAAYVF